MIYTNILLWYQQNIIKMRQLVWLKCMDVFSALLSNQHITIDNAVLSMPQMSCSKKMSLNCIFDLANGTLMVLTWSSVCSSSDFFRIPFGWFGTRRLVTGGAEESRAEDPRGSAGSVRSGVTRLVCIEFWRRQIGMIKWYHQTCALLLLLSPPHR